MQKDTLMFRRLFLSPVKSYLIRLTRVLSGALLIALANLREKVCHEIEIISLVLFHSYLNCKIIGRPYNYGVCKWLDAAFFRAKSMSKCGSAFADSQVDALFGIKRIPGLPGNAISPGGIAWPSSIVGIS